MALIKLGSALVSFTLLCAVGCAPTTADLADEEAVASSSEALILSCGASVKRTASEWASANDTEEYESADQDECIAKTLTPGVLTDVELAARKAAVRLQAEANAVADCEHKLNTIAAAHTCQTKSCSLVRTTLSACRVTAVTEDPTAEETCILTFPGGMYRKVWTLQFSARAAGSMTLTCKAGDAGVPETGAPDSSPDSGAVDSGALDTGTVDSAPSPADSGTPDTGGS